MHVSAVPDIQPHTASVPPSAWTLCPWDSPKYEHLLEMYSIKAVQDVDEFVSSSDLEKCSIASLTHQWIFCIEWERANSWLKTSQ